MKIHLPEDEFPHLKLTHLSAMNHKSVVVDGADKATFRLPISKEGYFSSGDFFNNSGHLVIEISVLQQVGAPGGRIKVGFYAEVEVDGDSVKKSEGPELGLMVTEEGRVTVGKLLGAQTFYVPLVRDKDKDF